MHIKHIRTCLLMGSLIVIRQPHHGLAQQNSDASAISVQRGSMERDGQHDFDFEIGNWTTHLRRLAYPLTGSTTWVEFDGTTVVRRVWNGRANLVELEIDGSSGHLEGLTLRLYDPQSHQWSLYWATSRGGTIGLPTIGEFKNGRGEFFDQETVNGRAVQVRFLMSDITPNSALRTIILGRWRQDLGSELDRDRHAVARRFRQSALNSFPYGTSLHDRQRFTKSLGITDRDGSTK